MEIILVIAGLAGALVVYSLAVTLIGDLLRSMGILPKQKDR